MIRARRDVVAAVALIALLLAAVAAWRSWESTRPVLVPIGPWRVQPKIVCSAGTVIVLAPDGSLWGWGDNGVGLLGSTVPKLVVRPRRIGVETNWCSLALGDVMIAGIRSDGTLWTWGRDVAGPRGRPQNVGDDRDWAAVGAGMLRFAGVKLDGTLWGWGSGLAPRGAGTTASSPVQLGTNTNWLAFPAAFAGSCGVQRDGSLWVLGSETAMAAPPSRRGTATNWVAAQGRYSLSLARKVDGAWWAWGQTLVLMVHGADGSPTFPDQPICLPETDRWEAVAVGAGHVLGLTRNGAMRALGYNNAGQLGDGSAETRPTPVEIGNERTWVAIGAGNQFSVALASDGSLCTWGQRLGEPSERSWPVRTLGAWARRIGLGVSWADPKPPRFDTKPRCILRFTTNAPAAPR